MSEAIGVVVTCASPGENGGFGRICFSEAFLAMLRIASLK